MSNQLIRYLGMPNLNQSQWLHKIQASPYLMHSIDSYSQGELVDLLETKVAKLLNKESAIFFSKGITAQLCVLKVSAEKSQNNKIMIHPKSHIAIDEQNAYQHLLGLEGILLGKPDTPFSFEDIQKTEHQVASCVIELPLRRSGFKLPSWQELSSISDWAKQEYVHLHMDGARLWESTDFYQKSTAQISDLFDSVYVSLYKGLGGMGGAILAGDAEFIENCKIWRTRLGGDNFTAFPMLISGLDGLDNQLEKIPSLVRRAQEIAKALSIIPQLEVNTPQTNGFFIFVQGDLTSLNNKVTQLNKAFGLKLFNGFNLTEKTNRLMVEIQIVAEHRLISTQEILKFFTQLF